MPGYHINSEACRRQGFHFRQVYAALRFSRDKNKAGILDVYWDCGFLGVKDGNLHSHIVHSVIYIVPFLRNFTIVHLLIFYNAFYYMNYIALYMVNMGRYKAMTMNPANSASTEV